MTLFSRVPEVSPLRAGHRADADVPPVVQPADERAARLMDAIEGVYRVRFSTFHRVATAITGNADAGCDAVQEAFARAIRRRADFRGDGPLEGWLWRTVVNVAKDHCRTAKGMDGAVELLDLPDPSGRGPGDHSEQILRQRVATLPERQRVALFLRYYADMSYAEIGDALAIRTGTVSATLNAAHRALRKSLGDVLGDAPNPVGPAPRPARAASAAPHRRAELPAGVCVGPRAARPAGRAC